MKDDFYCIAFGDGMWIGNSIYWVRFAVTKILEWLHESLTYIFHERIALTNRMFYNLFTQWALIYCRSVHLRSRKWYICTYVSANVSIEVTAQHQQDIVYMQAIEEKARTCSGCIRVFVTLKHATSTTVQTKEFPVSMTVSNDNSNCLRTKVSLTTFARAYK
jgi:hypothetical protein